MTRHRSNLPRTRSRLIDLELHHAFGTRHAVSRGGIPFDSRSPAELQRIPVLEIHEEQARARIGGEVAERVEHHVARIVGDHKPVGADHVHEPGRAAPMRHVRPGDRVAARQEQRVGFGEPALLSRGEARAASHRQSGARRNRDLPRSNVLRAIRVHFAGRDLQRRRAVGPRAAVHAHAPPGGRVDQQQADIRLGRERLRQRVVVVEPGGDVQAVVRRDRQEPGRAPEQARPHAPAGIARTDDDEGALERELPRQGRDRRVDAAPDPLGVERHTGPPLHLELTLVERAHQKNPHDGAPATGAARPAAPVGL